MKAPPRALVNAIETERDRLAEVNPNPGRPTLHRLNRAEYANAIRDLLAVEVDVSGAVAGRRRRLRLRQHRRRVAGIALVSRYLSAASKISALAVGDIAVPASYQTYDIPRGLIQLDRMSEAMPLGAS